MPASTRTDTAEGTQLIADNRKARHDYHVFGTYEAGMASAALARGLSQLAVDWPRRYHVEPWLVETLVDARRHHGGCYRAANFVALGSTSGRGRMDRHGRRGGEAPKTVLVYPVVRHAQQRLRES